MTPQITIRKTRIDDVRALVANLRPDDARECEKFGASPFKMIWRAYKSAKVCRSGFIGDRIVAIWGFNGSLLGFNGNVWLMSSNVADEIPFVFASIYRQEMRKMLKEYRTLEVFCDVAYTKSIKMMKIVGFKERESKPAHGGGFLVRMEMEGQW